MCFFENFRTFDKELTIVTPTYNRAHTLSRLYESLKKQTNKSFIWMIIDDGSTDNTKELIDKYIKENVIDINYVYKQNGGKASALNKSLDIAKTLYIVCLDSDDYFTENAVELSLKLLNQEKNNELCCGFFAIRSNPDGTTMNGEKIPQNSKYMTIKDLYNNGFNAELICFYKTEMAKKYRFPVFKNEKFISPTWFQYTITNDYYFRTSIDNICICEYYDDGLTKNKKQIIMKNPKGYTLMKRVSFSNSISVKSKLKNGIMYDCGCIIGRDKNWLGNAPFKFIAIISYPIAFIIYILKYKKHERK